MLLHFRRSVCRSAFLSVSLYICVSFSLSVGPITQTEETIESNKHVGIDYRGTTYYVFEFITVKCIC